MNNKNRFKTVFLIKLIIIILFSFSIVAQASGTVYYVDDNGNDANNGLSQQNAFKTLDKAFTRITSGDTVYLMEGYYKIPSLLKGKTFNANVTIAGYPNQVATLSAYVIPYSYTNNGLWSKVSSSKNIWKTTLSDSELSDPKVFYGDSTRFFTWYNYQDFVESDYTDNSWYNSNSRELYVMFMDSSKNPNQISLYISTNPYVIRLESNTLNNNAYVILSNLKFKYSSYGVHLFRQGNVVIQNSKFFAGKFGVYIDGNDISGLSNVNIKNNYFDGKQNPSWWEEDMKLKGEEETTAIWAQNFPGRIFINNNEITRWHGGVTLYTTSSGEAKNSEVSNNIFTGGRGSQIEIERYCYNSSWHHNIVFDSEFAGVSWAPADASASPEPCKFYNNQIVLKGIIHESENRIWDSYAIKVDKRNNGMKKLGSPS